MHYIAKNSQCPIIFIKMSVIIIGYYYYEMGYLTAYNAAKLTAACNDPERFILRDLIKKTEYVIKLAASKRCSSTLWSIPLVFYALNKSTLLNKVAAHFRAMGFYCRILPEYCIWISWRRQIRKQKGGQNGDALLF